MSVKDEWYILQIKLAHGFCNSEKNQWISTTGQAVY